MAKWSERSSFMLFTQSSQNGTLAHFGAGEGEGSEEGE